MSFNIFYIFFLHFFLIFFMRGIDLLLWLYEKISVIGMDQNIPRTHKLRRSVPGHRAVHGSRGARHCVGRAG